MNADLSAAALERLSKDDLIREAQHVLLEVYHEGAGEEALARALMAERKRDGDNALFWVKVFAGIVEQYKHMPEHQVVRCVTGAKAG